MLNYLFNTWNFVLQKAKIELFMEDLHVGYKVVLFTLESLNFEQEDLF